MGQTLQWSAADARAATEDPSWPESLLDVPALVVDLREDDPAFEPPSLHRAPCPVVGLTLPGTEPSWTVDVSLGGDEADVALLGGSVDAAVSMLTARAEESPLAAATMARVLRVTPELEVEAALEIESLAYSMLLAGPEFGRWLDGRAASRSTADDTSDVVLTERSGGVLHVVLNRPHVHNAYNAAMRDALAEALAVALVDWSVGTVELTGNGPSFCSGGDLGEFGTAVDPVHAHLVRTTRSVGAVMHRLRDRLTVTVHGSCIGAGVELPAFARRVVAQAGTSFRLPEVGMGLIPGAGGTVSLPRRIGPDRTMLLALSGVALPLADAVRWGLVDTVA